MQFKDLLEVLDSNEKLFVTVTNEWGDGFYEDDVDNFRENVLMSNLRVELVYTRIIDDKEHFGFRLNRTALTTEIEVTLYDDENKIVFPKSEED